MEHIDYTMKYDYRQMLSISTKIRLVEVNNEHKERTIPEVSFKGF